MTKESEINIALADHEIDNMVKLLEEKAMFWLKIEQFDKAKRSAMLAEKIKHQQAGIK